MHYLRYQLNEKQSFVQGYTMCIHCMYTLYVYTAITTLYYMIHPKHRLLYYFIILLLDYYLIIIWLLDSIVCLLKQCLITSNSQTQTLSLSYSNESQITPPRPNPKFVINSQFATRVPLVYHTCVTHIWHIYDTCMTITTQSIKTKITFTNLCIII